MNWETWGTLWSFIYISGWSMFFHACAGSILITSDILFHMQTNEFSFINLKVFSHGFMICVNVLAELWPYPCSMRTLLSKSTVPPLMLLLSSIVSKDDGYNLMKAWPWEWTHIQQTEEGTFLKEEEGDGNEVTTKGNQLRINRAKEPTFHWRKSSKRGNRRLGKGIICCVYVKHKNRHLLLAEYLETNLDASLFALKECCWEALKVFTPDVSWQTGLRSLPFSCRGTVVPYRRDLFASSCFSESPGKPPVKIEKRLPEMVEWCNETSHHRYQSYCLSRVLCDCGMQIKGSGISQLFCALLNNLSTPNRKDASDTMRGTT